MTAGPQTYVSDPAIKPPAQFKNLQEAREAEKANRDKKIYDSYLPDSGATTYAQPYDWYTPDECRKAADVGAYDTWGYKNHFTACIVFRPRIQFKRCSSGGSCTNVGEVSYRTTVIGRGRDDTRAIEWDYILDSWQSKGTYDNSTKVSAMESCDGLEYGRCNPTTAYVVEKSITEWKNSGVVTFGFEPVWDSAPSDDAHPEDQVTLYGFLPVFMTTGDFLTPSTSTLFRCDNASYMNKGRGGCIFTGIRANVHFNYNEPSYKESVEFIHQAMDDLDGLMGPGYVGLYVPGGYYKQPLTGKYAPLTRNYHGNRGRHRVQAKCEAMYPNYTQGPNGTVRECDEYPFSSTYQNANYDDPGTSETWACKPVEKSQNGAAGNLLGSWYNADHILDGDEFFVTIDNAP